MDISDLNILEQYPDAMVFSDSEGVIRIFNKAAEAILGFSKHEAIGSSLDIMIPEGLRAAHWQGFKRAMANANLKYNGRAMTTKALCRDGSFIYLSVSFSLIRDEAGKVLGSVANCRSLEKQ